MEKIALFSQMAQDMEQVETFEPKEFVGSLTGPHWYAPMREVGTVRDILEANQSEISRTLSKYRGYEVEWFSIVEEFDKDITYLEGILKINDERFARVLVIETMREDFEGKPKVGVTFYNVRANQDYQEEVEKVIAKSLKGKTGVSGGYSPRNSFRTVASVNKTASTGKDFAKKIADQFAELKRMGRNAAIDYASHSGEIALMCSKPTDNIKTWGKGAVPEPFDARWVRLVQC